MYGCGCWVEEDININENDKCSISICTTGCGEYIIKTLLSQQCAHHIINNNDDCQYNLDSFFNKQLFKSKFLKLNNDNKDKLVGAMICKLDYHINEEEEKSLELIVAHTTPSMCFGYMSSLLSGPKSVMSRIDESKRNDESVMISSFHFDIK
jgi:hypothetical protein